METPAPFSLDKTLGHWLDRVRRLPAISAEDRQELEMHLRDSIERLRVAGLSDEEAWIIAQKRLGQAEMLAHEFSKMEEAGGKAAPAGSAAQRNRSIIAIGAGFVATVAFSLAGEWWASLAGEWWAVDS